ncbi:unnamed protein product [Alternaria sp. RS040]
MYFTAVATATFLTLIPRVLSHGLITSPPSRPTGPSLNSLCGPAITRTINNDNTSHVEGLPELLAAPYSASTCNLWLCKGLQFSDNPANNTQIWSAGQVVPLKVWIRIPHEGSANVSIVDTKRNEIVGNMLKVWEEGYAPGKTESDVPIGQREFSVTIPEGLEEKCAVAGDCVSTMSALVLAQ